MRLQTKVFVTTALIFFLHFLVNTYIGQRQIKSEVITNIMENARTVRGMLMSYRGIYQKIFIDHNIPIDDQTIEFLPAHAISRISHNFKQWVDTGLSFNNVSDRPRNLSNQADDIELLAIDFFRKNPQINEHFTPFSTPSGEKFFHFSQPIIVKPLCMKCHGKKENAPPSIQQRYDSAYNYEIGDLRGIMSIKLPAAIIEQRTTQLLKNNLYINFFGMILAFILIAIFMSHTVLFRIKKLQSSSEKLAAGDYNTQVVLSGNDELTDVGQAFNHMAQTIAQREQDLLKQQSLYHALSETNKSVIQLDSSAKLFNRLCCIAISQPHLIMAWVGEVNTEKNQLEPVSSAGRSNDCINEIDFNLDPNSPNPINLAFHNKRIAIINDYLNDPATLMTQKQAQTANIKSVASLPISKNNKVIAIFSVYSDQKDFFNHNIVNLLDEMIKDIEYAIEHYALQEQHTKAQQQLKTSSQELSSLNELMLMLLESTGEGIFGIDLQGKCTFVNHAALEMLGYSLSELKGQLMHDLTHHSHKDGSVLTKEDCHILIASRKGKPCHIDDDVFWKKDGSSFPVQYSAYPIRDKQQNISGSVTVFRDITESQAITRKMNYLASHDSLTNLLNRHSFEQRLNLALDSAHFENSQHAVCYLDLDQFKVINDTCGHLAGDEMLKVISRLLKDNVRKNDTLARLGGDEFGLLLEECSLERARQLAENICEKIKDFHFIWSDKAFKAGVSIGIAAITQESESVQSVMSAIDSACYIAKDKGRNQVHIFHSEDSEAALRQGEMQWVSEISKALEEDRFILYQQEIISSEPLNEAGRHFEILLRLRDSHGNIIPPGAFLPAAERYDLMADIDRWVISNTFKWLASQLQKQEKISFCSINLSGQSVGDEKLYQHILQQQQLYQLNSEIICFEVTESAAVIHLERAIQFIWKLNKQGFLFALDDFGTGMSSFAYLKNFPVNFLKIDGSFVKDILYDPIDHAMVKSINDIGHLMGLKTIAEYVENSEIQEELTKMKIDYLQGYGISKPQPCDN